MKFPYQQHDVETNVFYQVHGYTGQVIAIYESLASARKHYKEIMEIDGSASITKKTVVTVRAETFEHVQGNQYKR